MTGMTARPASEPTTTRPTAPPRNLLARRLLAARLALGRLVLGRLVLGAILAGTAQIALPAPSDARSPDASEPYAASEYAATGSVVGVASANVFRDLPRDKARHDIRLLSQRANVDVIGWQEAERWRGLLTDLRGSGWATKQFYGEPDELAVSWRMSEFRFRSASYQRMHDGAGPRLTAVPFGPRFVLRVTLTQRGTGRTFTVLDTHANSFIEDLDRPGNPLANLNADRARLHFARMRDLWARVESRYVVATGDLNVDYAADARVRADGFPADSLRWLALPSYAALPTDGLLPTHPASGRNIDYVSLDRRTYDERAAFVSHRVLTGYYSDHRPIVARIALH